MGCGASAGAARVEQPAHNKGPEPEADSEKLEMRLKMARVSEWASSVGPAPWEDINEASLRLGMKTGPRLKGDRRASYSSKDSHPAKPRSQSRERELRQRQKELLDSPAIDSPLSPDGDNSTHISGNEIRDADGKSSRRPRDTAPEAISVGRPALSTEGWNKGEPSVGASEEMDKLAGLGKAKLSSGGLRSALKSLHESIMGKSSLQHAFYEFDKNKDNRISREEFLEACSDMTTKLPESQLAELFKLMDIDGNGYISREEFIKAFEPKFDLPKHPSADDMIAAARRKKNDQKASRGLLVKAKTMDLQHKMVGKG